MKKIIICVIIGIVAITLGIVVGYKVETGKNKNIVLTVQENNITSNKISNNENTIKEQIGNNEIVNEVETEVIEEPKTDLEKAIDIVKNDWGEDNTVYFAEDGQTTNGEYVICVRDNSTTNARAWYTVNTTTGAFIKE